MPSPVGDPHGEMAQNANGWLFLYKSRTPGVRGAADATTFLGDESEPQPDALLRISPKYGGQTRREGIYIVGAPELVLEVEGSTRKIDLGPKRRDYERAGVLEYIVVSLEPAEVHWHIRRDGQLKRDVADADGIHRSSSFPGLWLDPSALVEGDSTRLIAVLEWGLASPEHAAFAARLAPPRDEDPGVIA